MPAAISEVDAECQGPTGVHRYQCSSGEHFGEQFMKSGPGESFWEQLTCNAQPLLADLIGLLSGRS